MKLTGQAALRYFARPEPGRAGLLIYGADAMRVSLRRQQVVAAMLGPAGEAEMRLARMTASDLRSDPARLQDAMRAQGFFPGPRVVLVEDAGDGSAPAIAEALAAWATGDAALVVTAGSLAAKSALRKLFEDHPNAQAAGVYDDPPGQAEIEEMLTAAGLAGVPRDAMSVLSDLARLLDPGDFRQTIGKIALYKRGDSTPLSATDIADCAPATVGAEVDDVLNAAAEAEAAMIGPLMQRLSGQGIAATSLAIGATRHFRTLHTAASDPGGPASGIARVRPPVFGPRRDRMLRQAQAWSPDRLEQAMKLLIDTDLALRSSSRAPGMAVMERALIRLATMRRR